MYDLKALNDLRAERHNVAAVAHNYQSARELVVLVAANAYLQALAASARAESARAQNDTALALFNQATDLRQNGLAAGIEVLRAQVELDQQRAAVTGEIVALGATEELVELGAGELLFPRFGPGNEPLRNGCSRIRRHTHGGLSPPFGISVLRGRGVCRFDARAGVPDDLRARKALFAEAVPVSSLIVTYANSPFRSPRLLGQRLMSSTSAARRPPHTAVGGHITS